MVQLWNFLSFVPVTPVDLRNRIHVAEAFVAQPVFHLRPPKADCDIIWIQVLQLPFLGNLSFFRLLE